MSFINSQDPAKPKPKLPTPSVGMLELPQLPTPVQVEPTIDEILGEDEDDWDDWDDDDEFFEAPKPNLNPSRPKKDAEPKKDKNLNLSRFG